MGKGRNFSHPNIWPQPWRQRTRKMRSVMAAVFVVVVVVVDVVVGATVGVFEPVALSDEEAEGQVGKRNYGVNSGS